MIGALRHRSAFGGLIAVAVVKRPQAWFAGTLAIYAAAWLWAWSRFTEWVRIHFFAGGQVDEWSSRGSA